MVWRAKTLIEEGIQGKDKGKAKAQGPESTPITRQGYRSGRLAEDFWTVLGIPKTPPSSRKKLRVIPFITKVENQTEYLADKSNHSLNSITEVNVAELLAGIPWSAHRAKQHVVNEVAQALHKVLIFSNNLTSPFQKWTQGIWHANWTTSTEGEHTCTLYVTVAVPEAKVKIGKGPDFGWVNIPGPILTTIQGNTPEQIQDATSQGDQWQAMAGTKELSTFKPHPMVASPNRYAVLSGEETFSS